MLLYGYKHFRDEAALARDPVREMARLYVIVRQQIKAAEEVEDDPRQQAKYSAEELAKSREVLSAVRRETAELHAGNPENVGLWQQFMPWCLEEIDRIYRRLNVRFDFTHGESFYQPMLAEVVEDLLRKGIAKESEGAIAIFLNPDEPPALIRKKDGAYTYTTSDLATIQYRVREWHADTILYVVDFRQALHFKNLFEAGAALGLRQGGAAAYLFRLGSGC
ncbi:MAG: hypothetical protein KatS3mg105_3991 [Gemmatales bacterium]|nr:MAG: hypothetical protein KatS3mg105_3991 [Gemmatales bacterium]